MAAINDARGFECPLAFLGLGAMGAPIAGRLLAAGFPLTVWNRSPERAKPLVEKGARLAATPAEAARGAGVVLLMLADPAAVESVTGGEEGVLAGLGAGALLCDLSTVDPETSRRVAARAA